LIFAGKPRRSCPFNLHPSPRLTASRLLLLLLLPLPLPRLVAS